VLQSSPIISYCSSTCWLSNLIYKLFLSYLDSHALLVGSQKYMH